MLRYPFEYIHQHMATDCSDPSTAFQILCISIITRKTSLQIYIFTETSCEYTTFPVKLQTPENNPEGPNAGLVSPGKEPVKSVTSDENASDVQVLVPKNMPNWVSVSRYRGYT